MSGRSPTGTASRPTVEFERSRVRSAAGISLDAIHLRCPAEAPAALAIDERFATLGIESPDRLIDLAATEARWGAPAGLVAEEALASAPEGTLGFCPTNFGWQRGAFLVSRGRVQSLPADPLLRGERLVWGRGSAGWSAHRLDLAALERGDAASRALLRSLVVGLEMPAIVRAGRPVPRPQWIRHPRLLADLRNAFDFALGRGTDLPDSLWAELRQVLPASEASALALARGEGCRERRPLSSDALRLSGRLKAAGLDHVALSRLDERTVEVSIRGPLPPARLPLVGVGCRADGSLDVTLIDGRRTDAPGATIEELAALMAGRGVVDGGLGSAGGDVALVRRRASGLEVLSTPSNLCPSTGAPRLRRTPSLLLLPPPSA